MDRADFQVVFDKLSDAAKGTGGPMGWVFISEVTPEELDEIAELRRLSDELTPPDVISFTTT